MAKMPKKIGYVRYAEIYGNKKYIQKKKCFFYSNFYQQAFKTPLSTKFDSQVPDQFMFTPTLLFELMASYKVGIIYFLSNF